MHGHMNIKIDFELLKFGAFQFIWVCKVSSMFIILSLCHLTSP